MKVVERMIQKWKPEAEAKMRELAEKYGDLDAKWGFPPQRQYRCFSGSIPFDYVVSERTWESMEAMEKTYARAMATPEWKAFMEVASAVSESHRAELYVPIEEAGG
jgi:hypothetical protein